MDSGKTVLIVEDSAELLEINSRMLELRGYMVLTAPSLQDARKMLSSSGEQTFPRPDVVVLDIMLPDGSGIDFCREIRGSLGIPILFLSILSDKSDIISALRAGGDDYLSKPFDFDVLEARIEALLRRVSSTAPDATDEITMGCLKLDSLSGRAYVDGRDARLTNMEFLLLKLLIKNEGSIIPNEDIYKLIWGNDGLMDYRTVKQHIYSLRKKLGEAGVTCFEIESSRGSGYRIILQSKSAPSDERSK